MNENNFFIDEAEDAVKERKEIKKTIEQIQKENNEARRILSEHSEMNSPVKTYQMSDEEMKRRGIGPYKKSPIKTTSKKQNNVDVKTQAVEQPSSGIISYTPEGYIEVNTKKGKQNLFNIAFDLGKIDSSFVSELGKIQKEILDLFMKTTQEEAIELKNSLKNMLGKGANMTTNAGLEQLFEIINQVPQASLVKGGMLPTSKGIYSPEIDEIEIPKPTDKFEKYAEKMLKEYDSATTTKKKESVKKKAEETMSSSRYKEFLKNITNRRQNALNDQEQIFFDEYDKATSHTEKKAIEEKVKKNFGEKSKEYEHFKRNAPLEPRKIYNRHKDETSFIEEKITVPTINGMQLYEFGNAWNEEEEKRQTALKSGKHKEAEIHAQKQRQIETMVGTAIHDDMVDNKSWKIANKIAQYKYDEDYSKYSKFAAHSINAGEELFSKYGKDQAYAYRAVVDIKNYEDRERHYAESGYTPDREINEGKIPTRPDSWIARNTIDKEAKSNQEQSDMIKKIQELFSFKEGTIQTDEDGNLTKETKMLISNILRSVMDLIKDNGGIKSQALTYDLTSSFENNKAFKDQNREKEMQSIGNGFAPEYIVKMVMTEILSNLFNSAKGNEELESDIVKVSDYVNQQMDKIYNKEGLSVQTQSSDYQQLGNRMAKLFTVKKTHEAGVSRIMNETGMSESEAKDIFFGNNQNVKQDESDSNLLHTILNKVGYSSDNDYITNIEALDKAMIAMSKISSTGNHGAKELEEMAKQYFELPTEDRQKALELFMNQITKGAKSANVIPSNVDELFHGSIYEVDKNTHPDIEDQKTPKERHQMYSKGYQVTSMYGRSIVNDGREIYDLDSEGNNALIEDMKLKKEQIQREIDAANKNHGGMNITDYNKFQDRLSVIDDSKYTETEKEEKRSEVYKQMEEAKKSYQEKMTALLSMINRDIVEVERVTKDWVKWKKKQDKNKEKEMLAHEQSKAIAQSEVITEQEKHSDNKESQGAEPVAEMVKEDEQPIINDEKNKQKAKKILSKKKGLRGKLKEQYKIENLSDEKIDVIDTHESNLQNAITKEQNKIEKSQNLVKQLDKEREAFEKLNKEIKNHADLMGKASEAEKNKTSASNKVVVNTTSNIAEIDSVANEQDIDTDLGLRETGGMDNIVSPTFLSKDPKVNYVNNKLNQGNQPFGSEVILTNVTTAELNEEDHSYREDTKEIKKALRQLKKKDVNDRKSFIENNNYLKGLKSFDYTDDSIIDELIAQKTQKNAEKINVDFSASQTGILGMNKPEYNQTPESQKRQQIFDKLMNEGSATFQVDGVSTTVKSVEELEKATGFDFRKRQKNAESIIFGNASHKIMELLANGNYSSVEDVLKSKEWDKYLKKGQDLKQYKNLGGNQDDFVNHASELATNLNLAMGGYLTSTDISKENKKALAEKHLVGTYLDPNTGESITMAGTFDSIMGSALSDFKTGKIDIQKFAMQLSMLRDLAKGAASQGMLGKFNEDDIDEMMSQIVFTGKNGEHGRFTTQQLTDVQKGETLSTIAHTLQYKKDHNNLSEGSYVVDESLNIARGTEYIESEENRKIVRNLKDYADENTQASKLIEYLKQQGFEIGEKGELNAKDIYTQSFTRVDKNTGRTLKIDAEFNKEGLLIGGPDKIKASDESYSYENTYESEYKNLRLEEERIKGLRNKALFENDLEQADVYGSQLDSIRRRINNNSKFSQNNRFLWDMQLLDPELGELTNLKAVNIDNNNNNAKKQLQQYKNLVEERDQLNRIESFEGLSPVQIARRDSLNEEIGNIEKRFYKIIGNLNDEFSKKFSKDFLNTKDSLNNINTSQFQAEVDTKINELLEEREKIYSRLIQLQKKGNEESLSEEDKIMYQQKKEELEVNTSNIDRLIGLDGVSESDRKDFEEDRKNVDESYNSKRNKTQDAVKSDTQRNNDLKEYIKQLKEVNKLELERSELQHKVSQGGPLAAYNQRMLSDKEVELAQAQENLNNFGFDRTTNTFSRNTEDGKRTYTLNTSESDNLKNAIAEEDVSYSRRSKLQQEKNMKPGFFAQFAQNIKDEFHQYVGYSLTYQIIGSLRQAMTAVIEQTKQLNKTMIDIQIVTGSSNSEVSKMIDTYNEYAKVLGVTTQEVANSANQFLRMGYNAEESAKLIENSMKLSKLGMIEATQAAEYLTSAIKGYQLTVDQSSKVVDMATTLDMSYAVDAGYIFEAMSRTATSAKLAKVEMSELQSMIAVIGETTQKEASVIGESLKTAFARYGNVKSGVASSTNVNNLSDIDAEELENVNDIEKVLTTYDIDVRESDNKTWRSYSDIMKDINEQWAKYSDFEKNAISTAMFGTRQRENGLVVLENYNEVLKANEKAINSEGQATKKYQIYLEGVEAAQNRLTVAIEDFIKRLQGSNALKLFYNMLAGIVEHLDQVGVILGLIAAINLTHIVTALGKMSNIWGGGLLNFGEKMTIIGSDVKKNGLKGVWTGTKEAFKKSTDEIKQDAEDRLAVQEIQTTNSLLSEILAVLKGESVDNDDNPNNENPDIDNDNPNNENPDIDNDNPNNENRRKNMSPATRNAWATAGSALSMTGGMLLGNAIGGDTGNVVSTATMIGGQLLTAFDPLIGGIFGIVTTAVGGFLSWRKKKEEERIKEAQKAYQESLEKVNNVETNEDKFKRYDELAKGVNSLGNNVHLDDSEYDEFISLGNELGDAFPELISNVDSAGNSLLGFDGKIGNVMDGLDAFVNNLNKQNAKDYLNEDNLKAVYKTEYEEIEKLEKEIKDDYGSLISVAEDEMFISNKILLTDIGKDNRSLSMRGIDGEYSINGYGSSGKIVKKSDVKNTLSDEEYNELMSLMDTEVNLSDKKIKQIQSDIQKKKQDIIRPIVENSMILSNLDYTEDEKDLLTNLFVSTIDPIKYGEGNQDLLESHTKSFIKNAHNNNIEDSLTKIQEISENSEYSLDEKQNKINDIVSNMSSKLLQDDQYVEALKQSGYKIDIEKGTVKKDGVVQKFSDVLINKIDFAKKTNDLQQYLDDNFENKEISVSSTSRYNYGTAQKPIYGKKVFYNDGSVRYINSSGYEIDKDGNKIGSKKLNLEEVKIIENKKYGVSKAQLMDNLSQDELFEFMELSDRIKTNLAETAKQKGQDPIDVFKEYLMRKTTKDVGDIIDNTFTALKNAVDRDDILKYKNYTNDDLVNLYNEWKSGDKTLDFTEQEEQILNQAEVVASNLRISAERLLKGSEAFSHLDFTGAATLSAKEVEEKGAEIAKLKDDLKDGKINLSEYSESIITSIYGRAEADGGTDISNLSRIINEEYDNWTSGGQSEAQGLRIAKNSSDIYKENFAFAQNYGFTNLGQLEKFVNDTGLAGANFNFEGKYGEMAELSTIVDELAIYRGEKFDNDEEAYTYIVDNIGGKEYQDMREQGKTDKDIAQTILTNLYLAITTGDFSGFKKIGKDIASTIEINASREYYENRAKELHSFEDSKTDWQRTVEDYNEQLEDFEKQRKDLQKQAEDLEKQNRLNELESFLQERNLLIEEYNNQIEIMNWGIDSLASADYLGKIDLTVNKFDVLFEKNNELQKQFAELSQMTPTTADEAQKIADTMSSLSDQIIEANKELITYEDSLRVLAADSLIQSLDNITKVFEKQQNVFKRTADNSMSFTGIRTNLSLLGLDRSPLINNETEVDKKRKQYEEMLELQKKYQDKALEANRVYLELLRKDQDKDYQKQKEDLADQWDDLARDEKRAKQDHQRSYREHLISMFENARSLGQDVAFSEKESQIIQDYYNKAGGDYTPDFVKDEDGKYHWSNYKKNISNDEDLNKNKGPVKKINDVELNILGDNNEKTPEDETKNNKENNDVTSEQKWTDFQKTWDERFVALKEEALMLDEEDKTLIVEQFTTLGNNVAKAYIDSFSSYLNGDSNPLIQRQGPIDTNGVNIGMDILNKNNKGDSKTISAMGNVLLIAIEDALKEALEQYDKEKIQKEELKLSKPELLGYNSENNSLTTDGGKDGFGEQGLIQDIKNALTKVYEEISGADYKLEAPTPDKTTFTEMGKIIGQYISDGIDEGVELSIAKQAENSIMGENAGGASSSGHSSGATLGEGSVSGNDIVSLARKQLGKPYVFGAGRGISNNAFDCSGLTQYVYKQHGIQIGGTAEAQWNENKGTKIDDVSQLQPGDLLFYKDTYKKGISHVGIYSGNGKMIDARGTSWGVVERPVDLGSHYVGAKRYHSGGTQINEDTAIGRLIAAKAREKGLAITSKSTADELAKMDLINGLPKLTVDQISKIISTYFSKSPVISSSDALGMYKAQEQSGISALALLGIGALESGYGTSNIAKKKNNIWGWGATNINPLGNAVAFDQIATGAIDYADNLKRVYYNNRGAKSIYAIGSGDNPSGKGYAYHDNGTVDASWVDKVSTIMRKFLNLFSYSKGTSNHKGGKALLGDENFLKGNNTPSPETLIYPDGRVELVGQDGPVIKDIPTGTQVLTTSQTKKLFTKIPHYAEGTDSISLDENDIAKQVKDAIDNLLKDYKTNMTALSNYVSELGLGKISTLQEYRDVDKNTIPYEKRTEYKASAKRYAMQDDLAIVNAQVQNYLEQQQKVVDYYNQRKSEGATAEELEKILETIDSFDTAIEQCENQINEWVSEIVAACTAVKDLVKSVNEHENALINAKYELGNIIKNDDFFDKQIENSREVQEETKKALNSVMTEIYHSRIQAGDTEEQAWDYVAKDETVMQLKEDVLNEMKSEKDLRISKYDQELHDLERSKYLPNQKVFEFLGAFSESYAEESYFGSTGKVRWEQAQIDHYRERLEDPTLNLSQEERENYTDLMNEHILGKYKAMAEGIQAIDDASKKFYEQNVNSITNRENIGVIDTKGSVSIDGVSHGEYWDNVVSEIKERNEDLEQTRANTEARLIEEATNMGLTGSEFDNYVYGNEELNNIINEQYENVQKINEQYEERLNYINSLIDNQQKLLDLEKSERWTNAESITSYYEQTASYIEMKRTEIENYLKLENLSKEEYNAKLMELAQLDRDLFDTNVQKLKDLQEFYNSQYESMKFMVQEYTNALNDEKDAISEKYDEEISKLEQVNEQKERSIKLTELQTALDNAKKEKKRIYRAGVGFVYEEDREAIKEAEDALDDFYKQDRIDSLNKAKELELKALDERIEGWNKYLEAIEKVYQTAERHDHMNRLENKWGVEGWSGIWNYLDSDLSNYLINEENGEDIYYGSQTEFLDTYINTSEEIYKKMDEAVQILSNIYEYQTSNDVESGDQTVGFNGESLVQDNMRINKIDDLSLKNWKTWTNIISDYSSLAKSPEKLAEMSKLTGFEWTTTFARDLHAQKADELTLKAQEIIKDPNKGMQYIYDIVTGVRKNDSGYNFNDVKSLYHFAMQELAKTDNEALKKYRNVTLNTTSLGKILGIDLDNLSNATNPESDVYKALKEYGLSDENIQDLKKQQQEDWKKYLNENPDFKGRKSEIVQEIWAEAKAFGYGEDWIQEKINSNEELRKINGGWDYLENIYMWLGKQMSPDTIKKYLDEGTFEYMTGFSSQVGQYLLNNYDTIMQPVVEKFNDDYASSINNSLITGSDSDFISDETKMYFRNKKIIEDPDLTEEEKIALFKQYPENLGEKSIGDNVIDSYIKEYDVDWNDVLNNWDWENNPTYKGLTKEVVEIIADKFNNYILWYAGHVVDLDPNNNTTKLNNIGLKQAIQLQESRIEDLIATNPDLHSLINYMIKNEDNYSEEYGLPLEAIKYARNLKIDRMDISDEEKEALKNVKFYEPLNTEELQEIKKTVNVEDSPIFSTIEYLKDYGYYSSFGNQTAVDIASKKIDYPIAVDGNGYINEASPKAVSSMFEGSNITYNNGDSYYILQKENTDYVTGANNTQVNKK